MRIKVLQILAGGKEYNGVSDFLLSYYSQMDRDKIHFDFLFCRENTMRTRSEEPVLKKSEFIELNLQLSGKLCDLIATTKKVAETVKQGNYDIIHINTGSISITASCILGALYGGAKRIISHSHNTAQRGKTKRGRLKSNAFGLANCIMRMFIRHKSSLLFACSDEAGAYLFGKKGLKNKKYFQIKNAIQPELFIFNPNVRKVLRKECAIEDGTTVLGCVGRFSEQKNHRFLIDVFFEYHKCNPASVLWLIGEGETKAEIENKVKTMGLSDYVRFFGQRRDVNRLLQAMDAFVLTSYYEGLPIVTIEAQAAGLPVFLQEEISHGSDISDLVHFISLSVGAAAWGKIITQTLNLKKERTNMREAILQSGYDITQAVKNLEGHYLRLVV